MHCGSKFVPWRVKDLVSCFPSCHIHLEEEEPEISISKPQLQPSKGSKVFNSKNSHKGCEKVSTNANKMCNGGDRRELVERRLSENKIGRATTDRGNQREAAFAEEDYIVFCFREDGKIHLIDEEISQECHEKEEVNTTAAATTIVVSVDMKDDQKEIDDNGTKRPPDDDEKAAKDKKNHVEQANASTMEHSDCCDSSQSDSSSSSSFAFPELGMEWTGSPVHMPRAEKLEDEEDEEEETCDILQCYYHRQY